MKKLSVVIIVIGVMIFAMPIIGQQVTGYLENTMISAWQDGRDLEKDKVYNTVSAAYNKFVDIFNIENAADDSFTGDLEEQTEMVEGTEAGAGAEVGENTTTGSATEVKDTPSVQSPGVKTPTPAKATENKVVKVKKKTKQKVIGIIKIPDIKVSLPIVEGVKKENLRVGIGHFPGTAGLGEEGNCALAGHRSYALGMMFNRLNEVKKGDKITIITKEGKYVYQVYQAFVVLPKDVYILDEVKGDPTLTLVTCTPVRIATHRLVVRARLVEWH